MVGNWRPGQAPAPAMAAEEMSKSSRNALRSKGLLRILSVEERRQRRRRVDGGSGFFGGSSTTTPRAWRRRAGAAPAWRRRGGGIVGLQRQPLAVEDRGLARPLVFGQDGADLCGGAGVVQRTGHQPKLHAEAVGAFLHDDDRAQRRQRRVRSRFQQAAPQRAQAVDRIGAADIDPELGSLQRDLRRARASSSSSPMAPTPRPPGSGSR